MWKGRSPRCWKEPWRRYRHLVRTCLLKYTLLRKKLRSLGFFRKIGTRHVGKFRLRGFRARASPRRDIELWVADRIQADLLILALRDLQIKGGALAVDENRSRVQQLLAGAIVAGEAAHHAKGEEIL